MRGTATDNVLQDCAKLIDEQAALGLATGIVIAVPIPAEHAMAASGATLNRLARCNVRCSYGGRHPAGDRRSQRVCC